MKTARSILWLIAALAMLAGSACASEALAVGTDVALEDVNDFYYTFDASWYPPEYQRYRFYRADGAYWFFHETREGGGWPQTEEDTTFTGTVELTGEQWAEFLSRIEGGTAREREEHLDDGDPGPWLYLYWQGGPEEGWEYAFASPGDRFAFEEFCESLVGERPASPREVLAALREAITDDMTLPEIVDAFENVCGDGLILYETGTYSLGGGKPMFFFGLSRIFSRPGAEFTQVSVHVKYAPTDENGRFSDTVWSDQIEEDIFGYIRRSDAYACACGEKIKSVIVDMDEE